MAYQAIAQMQKKNRELFGENVGPKQPDRYYDSIDCGLKAMALPCRRGRSLAMV